MVTTRIVGLARHKVSIEIARRSLGMFVSSHVDHSSVFGRSSWATVTCKATKAAGSLGVEASPPACLNAEVGECAADLRSAANWAKVSTWGGPNRERFGCGPCSISLTAESPLS